MPSLVLAVEPDQRQASVIKRVVRERLDIELVIADSKDGALAALGDRVPDVVLLSALLSPRDESELAEHLRSLDDSEHVQTLTIPVFASTAAAEPEPKRKGGFLGKFAKKAKPAAAAPVGCDPAVFGDELATYCERAREMRDERAARVAREGRRKIDVRPETDGWAAVAQAPERFAPPPFDPRSGGSLDPPMVGRPEGLPLRAEGEGLPLRAQGDLTQEEISDATDRLLSLPPAPAKATEETTPISEPPTPVNVPSEPVAPRKPLMWLDRATTVAPRPELDAPFVAPRPAPVVHYHDITTDLVRPAADASEDQQPENDRDAAPIAADADEPPVIDLSAALDAEEVPSDADSPLGEPDFVVGPIAPDALAAFESGSPDEDASDTRLGTGDPDRIELPTISLHDFETNFGKAISDRPIETIEIKIEPQSDLLSAASAPIGELAGTQPEIALESAAEVSQPVLDRASSAEPEWLAAFNRETAAARKLAETFATPEFTSTPAVEPFTFAVQEPAAHSDSKVADTPELAASDMAPAPDIASNLDIPAPDHTARQSKELRLQDDPLAALTAFSSLAPAPTVDPIVAAPPPPVVHAPEVTPPIAPAPPIVAPQPVAAAPVEPEPAVVPPPKRSMRSPVAAARMLIAAAARSLGAGPKTPLHITEPHTLPPPEEPPPPPRVKEEKPTATVDARWIAAAIDGLRTDIKLLREERERQAAAAKAAAAAPPPAPAKAATRAETKRKAAKKPKRKVRQAPKPIQDEWGLYDPNQCGFEALMAEIEARQDEAESEEAEPEPADLLLREAPSQHAAEPIEIPDEEPDEIPTEHVVSSLRLTPLAMWARMEAADSTTGTTVTRDDLVALIDGLRLPAPVASVRYGSGCRIRRIRVAKNAEADAAAAATEPVIIISKKALRASNSKDRTAPA